MGKFIVFAVLLFGLFVYAKADVLGDYNRFGIGIQRTNDVGMFKANFGRRHGLSDFGAEFGLSGFNLFYDEDEFGISGDVIRDFSLKFHYEFINNIIIGTGLGLNIKTMRYMNLDRFDNWHREIGYRAPQFAMSPRIGFEWIVNENIKLQYRIIYSAAFGSIANKYLRQSGMAGLSVSVINHSLGNEITFIRDWISLNFGFSFFNIENMELRERNFTEKYRNTIALNTNLGVSILF